MIVIKEHELTCVYHKNECSEKSARMASEIAGPYLGRSNGKFDEVINAGFKASQRNQIRETIVVRKRKRSLVQSIPSSTIGRFDMRSLGKKICCLFFFLLGTK